MRQNSLLVIMGLGNPGKRYEKTRHNIGFRVVDAIRKRYGFSPWKMSEKYYSFVSEGTIARREVMLAKPYTFMNNSGVAVKRTVENCKLEIENVIVIHDDLTLPLGTLRIVKNRGPAGHQGVNSIIKTLETKDFVRFRIGTRPIKKRREQRQEMKTFVLQKFTATEEKTLSNVIAAVLQAIELTLKEGLAKAMTEYNRQLPVAPKKERP